MREKNENSLWHMPNNSKSNILDVRARVRHEKRKYIFADEQKHFRTEYLKSSVDRSHGIDLE